MPTAAERPLLERIALRYFRELNARAPDGLADELAGRRVEALSRGAVARAALAGALSSVVSGVAEVWADDRLAVPEGSGWSARAAYWGVVIGATAVASVLEILYLYWDALRTVHRMARTSGEPLRDLDGDGVALALARAALELPNPPEPLFGVNPRREVSKAQLVLAGLLYKGKVALTTFVLKLLLRRVLSRAFARVALAFVAVPVTALWNGVVAFWVMREARARVLGPRALDQALPRLLANVPAQSPVREVMLRGVASSIVRKRNLHPNLVVLLRVVHGAVPSAERLEELDSPARFLSALEALPPADRPAVLSLLAIATVLDGRTSRRERRLYAEAERRAGVTPGGDPLERARVRFLREGVLKAA